MAFEARHKRHLTKAFGSALRDVRLVVLGIPDDYAYMDPELVDRVRRQVTPLLRVVGGGR